MLINHKQSADFDVAVIVVAAAGFHYWFYMVSVSFCVILVAFSSFFSLLDVHPRSVVHLGLH